MVNGSKVQRALTAIGWVGLGLFVACSASEGGGDDNTGGAASGGKGGTGGTKSGGGSGGTGAKGGTGGGGGTTPSGGSAGASATGGAGTSGGGTGGDASFDVTFNYDSGGPDGFSSDASCTKTVVQAELTPLDMYIMLDKSSSMLDDNKWTNVRNALQTFLQDGSSAGIGAGIQFFPSLPTQYTSQCINSTQCGAYGPCAVSTTNPSALFCRACTTSLYSTPAVGIALLPGNAGTIINTMNAITPFGGTNTAPALQGAVDYAKSWATGHPGHKVIVVLASDGNPTTCTPTAINQITPIAATALSGTPSIQTFVIGVETVGEPNLLTNLDAIALAGGSTKAYVVSGTTSTTQQFIDAMNAIRKSTLGCEFKMPTTDAGIVDPTKVEVLYTPPGGSPQAFSGVANAGACGSGDGWYYNNPVTPTKILLCPKTCTTVQSVAGATIQISLGCLGS